ncbi:phosphotransferase [Humibacter ginsengiterrae]
MLWEAVDSNEALTTRFGFVDSNDATSWLGDTFRHAWGLSLQSCDRLVISADKLLAWLTIDGRGLIAKCAINPALFARLAEVDALITWLDGEGIPVAAPLPASDGRLRVDRDRYSMSLYPLVDGELLDVNDENQVAAAGRMLATLHHALSAYPKPFAGVHAPEGQQLVHGDFRSANVLYNGGVTAVLDFDEATHRSRAEELGRSAVLLGTRYHNWQPLPPAARAKFVTAYSDTCPLADAEWDEYARVVAGVSAHFGWA